MIQATGCLLGGRKIGRQLPRLLAIVKNLTPMMRTNSALRRYFPVTIVDTGAGPPNLSPVWLQRFNNRQGMLPQGHENLAHPVSLVGPVDILALIFNHPDARPGIRERKVKVQPQIEKKRSVFKECHVCQHNWQTRQDFIVDQEISLIGYQSNFVAIEKGLFLFNHSCGGTLGLGVQEFADLYDGPIHQERKTASESCPKYCLHANVLKSCPARCECAYVREILMQLSK